MKHFIKCQMKLGRGLTFTLFADSCRAELKISVISPVTATLGSDALLECTFTVDKFTVDLKFLAIVWSFNGKDLLKFVHGLKVLEPRASINETGIQNGDASLLISNVTVHDEGMYECSVIYSPIKRKEYVTLNPQARPEIFIPQREAIIGKEAFLRCCVLGFYPVEIDIAWLRDGQILPGTSTSKPQQYANGTFRINSTVALLPADSDAHLNFSCRVQHASLLGPLQEDIQLLLEEEEKGVSVAALVVSMVVILVFIAVGLLLFRKYAKEKEKLTMSEIRGPRVWTLGEPVQLVCVGFHCPKGIEIKWTKLNNGLETTINPNPMTDCQDTEPLLAEEGHKTATFKVRESRGYVTINSAVIVTPTIGEDEGAVFKCRFFTKDSKKINEEKEFKDFKIQGEP
ncbi:tapasin-related protein-like [Ambystoma mexicanum]|uniref:tapasin-related protein-like n=1 Tax=Ambystoma mexicanum TaxID=8296 RepID=UPI0037E8FC8E